MKVPTQNNVKITFLVVLLPIVVYRGENAAYKFIKEILKEYKYCKKVMNKDLNKNLIMSDHEKKNIYFNKAAALGFVKNLLIMMKKK